MASDLTVPPDFIARLAVPSDDPGVLVAQILWLHRARYVRWPKRGFLFWSGVTRHPDGRRHDCYEYPAEQQESILQAGLRADGRNNGPAILSFLIAGGERPNRSDMPNWGWSIHHIYDGRFPASPDRNTAHAVQRGDLFTHSAGLVAVHPLAEATAADVPLFAWLLRYEAFKRFQFDPGGVFEGLP